MQRKTKWTLAAGSCGAVLILLGGLLGWVAFPAIIESTVADTVAVKNGTDAWDRWIELPLPMQFKVYIFSVKNPEEVTQGADAEFEELGPFVYTETRAKENIDYREDTDRASYEQRSFFEFDYNASISSDTDTIIMVPNVPLVSFAQITEGIDALSTSIVAFNKAVETMWPDQYESTIFTKVSVHDYLFGGLDMICNQEPTLQNIEVILMCASYALVAPKTVIIGEDGINKFSFFNYKNDSTDGRYEVALGINVVEDIGQVKLWEGVNSTNKWGDETCNKIQGTDSTIFRPNLQDVEELYIYNTDICRTVKLTYKEETEFQGIAGRRYVTSKDVFAGVMSNSDNYCYCPQSVSHLTTMGGCLKDGLLELSSCQGAPVVLSHPHFLFADDSYKTFYPNLIAKEEDHQIYLDLEPYTGSPLRGASRIQMNINLKPIPEVDMMQNFSGALLPILWIEEGVELNDDLLDMLHEELLDNLDILNIVRWLLIGVGIAVLACAVAYYFIKIK